MTTQSSRAPMRLGPLVRNKLAGVLGRATSAGLVQRFARDKVVTREELTHDWANCCLRYGNSERFEINPPLSVNPLPDEIQRSVGEHRIEQPFVCEISDVELIGPQAVAITSNGQYVLEESLGSVDLLIRGLFAAVRRGMRPGRRSTVTDEPDIETACSLVGPWCLGYYHWFSDYLLRLEGLEYYVEETGSNPTILLPKNPPEWMISSLELAGFGEFERRTWRRGRLNIGSLVVPSLRRETEFTKPEKGYVFSPSAYQWLARRIRSNVEQKVSSAKIFVSRAQAEERHVINEAEVMDALEDRGFGAYQLENLSFREQVSLFKDAETIVGPTGAGLVNMIYAENADVITLFGSLFNACYPVLADSLGFGSAILNCEPKTLDMRADPEMLLDMLDRI